MTDKPTIPEVVDRLAAYHKRNSMWGSLHIVMEDGNVADSHVRFCHDYASERQDVEGVVLAGLLLRMSTTQRRKLFAMQP